MSKNFHSEPFDPETLEKLDLFQEYLKEWLYVFLEPHKPFRTTVNIFDFFAGPGKDLNGVKGSPLIILDSLYSHAKAIREKGLTVNVLFNEITPSKFNRLKDLIHHGYGGDLPIHITLLNNDFQDAFVQTANSMRGCANLLFLDQTGMKHITDDIFHEFLKLSTTDFIFFISSSFVRRFAEHDNFRRHVNFSKEQIMCHRSDQNVPPMVGSKCTTLRV